MSQIIIKTKDGDVKVDRELSKQCEYIKTQLATDESKDSIECPMVSRSSIERIFNFLKQNSVEPIPPIQKPISTPSMNDIVTDWAARFVDLEHIVLFELLLAADFLVVQPLIDLIGCKIATLIKGKSVEEIRKLFNIKNDFTPEEEAFIQSETSFLNSNR